MMVMDILRLIPQRDPILMVDVLLRAEAHAVTTRLDIRPDNLFLDEEGRMEESGLIEHIAQSASVLAGHEALLQGAKEPPVGYLGEVKSFCCLRRPQAGDTLITTIRQEATADRIRLLHGEVCCEGEIVATTQLKICL